MNNALKNIHSVLVIGLGLKTGPAVSNFLADAGFTVTVSDNKDAAVLRELIDQLRPSVQVVTGTQHPDLLEQGFDLVVLSPGVPVSIPLVQSALAKKISVVSEIELASWFLKGDIIAITGTDGKTTTTSLTGHVLRELGFDTFVGGNIGVPAVSFAAETTDESVTVLELSSFQLETIDTFRPSVAAILNVSPDHLDRYSGMAAYRDAKARIFMNQQKHDYFVYYKNDVYTEEVISSVRAGTILSFGVTSSDADIYLQNDMIFLPDRTELLSMNSLKIMGTHNALNVMAAYLMVRSLFLKRGLSIDNKSFAEACASFDALEHRMEIAANFEGRTFVNDSKATTIGSLLMAVNSLNNNGILIIGGRTKGDDYRRLNHELKGRVKTLVLIGESRFEFNKLFSGYDRVLCETMDEAVAAAWQKSSPGDVILLSPACASFDQYENYEQRGRHFKKLVQQLVEKNN